MDTQYNDITKTQDPEGEVSAAISLALHQYLDAEVHDYESYVITIKRKNR